MSYDWRANLPWTPVWETPEDLHAVLDTYRGWYAQGCSDSEISRRIQRQYGVVAQPRFKPKPKAKNYDALGDLVRNKGR